MPDPRPVPTVRLDARYQQIHPHHRAQAVTLYATNPVQPIRLGCVCKTEETNRA